MTAGLARDLVQFEKLRTISLKGKAVQVEVYTPLGPAAASVRVVWSRKGTYLPPVSGAQVGGKFISIFHRNNNAS